MTRRILFVSSHAKLGGAERYLEILMGGLEGTEIDVVCLEDGPFVERLEELGYRPDVLPTSKHATGILRSALRLRRRLRTAERPSVIHANNLKAALVAGLGALGTAIPMVWVKHDFSGDGRLARSVGRLSDRIVGVVTAVTETFGPGLRKKVVVIPNGIERVQVDGSRARQIVGDLIGDSLHGPVVGLVGRIHPWKGQLELIEVAPTILSRAPDAHILLLGGEDPSTPGYAGTVRDRIAASGAAARVHLAGHRTDAVTILAGLDVLVMPSVRDAKGHGRDAFPFVGLEAMSTGTPVVAYADGGLPEMFGECGRLVPPGNREELATAITDLLADQALRDRMAACGRDRVSRLYTVEKMIAAMERVYEDVSAP